MLRSIGLTLAAVVVAGIHEPRSIMREQDIRQLMAAARNAPTAICALAVSGVGNWGGRWADAPVTPLEPVQQPRDYTRRRGRDTVSTEDVRFLFDNLSINDACVREMAVRLLANAQESQVASGFTQRLAASDSSIRGSPPSGSGWSSPSRRWTPSWGGSRTRHPACARIPRGPSGASGMVVRCRR